MGQPMHTHTKKTHLVTDRKLKMTNSQTKKISMKFSMCRLCGPAMLAVGGYPWHTCTRRHVHESSLKQEKSANNPYAYQ